MFQNILLFYANFCGASVHYGKAPQILANFYKLIKCPKLKQEMLLHLTEGLKRN